MKVLLAVLTLLTASLGAYTQYMKSQMDSEKQLREKYEVYVSDWQDSVQCKIKELQYHANQNGCKVN